MRYFIERFCKVNASIISSRISNSCVIHDFSWYEPLLICSKTFILCHDQLFCDESVSPFIYKLINSNVLGYNFRYWFYHRSCVWL